MKNLYEWVVVIVESCVIGLAVFVVLDKVYPPYSEVSQLRKQGEYQAALDKLQQILALDRKLRHRAWEGATLNHLGMVYDDQRQYSQAMEYYYQALTIARDIDDRALEGTILNNLGGVYNNLGESSQVMEYLYQALVIYQQVGDRPGEGKTLKNLGVVYHNLGEYSQAMDYFHQALAIYRGVGDRAGEIWTDSSGSGEFLAEGRTASIWLEEDAVLN